MDHQYFKELLNCKSGPLHKFRALWLTAFVNLLSSHLPLQKLNGTTEGERKWVHKVQKQASERYLIFHSLSYSQMLDGRKIPHQQSNTYFSVFPFWLGHPLWHSV